MKKWLVWSMILVGEIYAIVYCGYLYDTTKEDVFRWLVIGGFLICALTSILMTLSMVERKEKKKDHSKECPYFIEVDE